MILFSASQRKSASTLIFDYQLRLVELTSKRNGQSILQKFADGRGYRGKLDFKTFLILCYISLFHGNIVLKTHSGPTFFVKLLVRLNLAKVTYSYRDPRDAALSILEHSKRTRKKLISQGKNIETSKGFANVIDLNMAINLVKEDLRNWHEWKSYGDVYFIRYEDFILNKIKFLEGISEYCEMTFDPHTLLEIVHECEGENNRNFNKGLPGRFNSELKPEEVSILNRIFHDDLLDMGYSR